MFELPSSLFSQILIALFAVAALIQLIYYFVFYLRPAINKSTVHTKKTPAVSVIICARNEANNLKAFLPSILEQDYSDFEVIVINDCSEDDTEDILESFSKNYPKLKVTTIHKDLSMRHNKKMALFLGIKAASNELLLLTDADCQPESSNWIRSHISAFTERTDFVLGYGAYLKKKGLLNKYIRFDTMFIAMQYLGMAKAGIPYMGVGRNLAYKRSVFFNNKGFGPHLNLQSGDDDLFVNALARKQNTIINTSPDSFTRSVPSINWGEFVKQKTRHMSTATHYRSLSKILLLAEPVSRLFFYFLFAILLLITTLQIPILITAATVLLSKLVIFWLTQKTLNEKDLLLFSLLFDIASPLLNMYFMLSVLFNKHQYYEWK